MCDLRVSGLSRDDEFVPVGRSVVLPICEVDLTEF